MKKVEDDPRPASKRWLSALLLLVLAGALLLLLWLIVAGQSATPVHVQALQAAASRPVKQNEVAPPPQADAETIDPAPSEHDDALNTAADIVPAGPKPKDSVRRPSLETASGPELEPGLTPGIVLQNMRSVVRDYSARFGGNPFGNNREITAKLNGANLKQVVFLKPEDGMRINERGELIDNWGTPFFFHQISGAEMEIHSAGRDRRMWTPDDLVIK